MKVAIFTPTFLPKCSGAEIFHHNLASQLAVLGHEPLVIMPRSLHRRLEAERWKLPYATIPFPAKIWSYFKYSVPVAFLISRFILSSLQRKHRFDVWHAVVLSPSGVCFANWQSLTGVPGLVRAVGDDVQPVAGAKNNPHMEQLIRSWIPQSRCVVSLSQSMSDQLGAMGVPGDRIEMIPNAFDASRFASVTDKAVTRDALDIPRNAFLFLCVARNHPQKDLPTLLDAFQILAARSSKDCIHMAIVGRGVPLLRSVVETMGLQGKVHLLELMPESASGSLPEFPPRSLVELYQAADAFVLSSLLEGFSSALLEAMAAGLPIIATSAPGITEQVEHGREALLSPCGNPERLAESMLKVYADMNLREKLGFNAAARAQHFSWENVALKYVRLYTRLIAEARRN